MSRRLHLDYETYSDLDLTKVGTSRYARHYSTEVLMCAYAFNDGPVRQWVPAEGEPIPDDLAEALVDPAVLKWAWNAPFEMAITEHVLGIEVVIEQWRDTMVQALHCSLPGKLETCGPVVGLPMDKQKDRRGKTLMRKFSFPRKPSKRDPSTRRYWHQAFDDWQEYLEYNRQDVIAERAILARLWKYQMSDDEWEFWFLDQRINRAGLPINRAMVENAIRVYEEALGSVEEGTGAFGEMAEITGLSNPNSLQQLLPWLQSQGYMFDDCKAGHIRTALRYFDQRPDHWTDEDWQGYRSNNGLRTVLALRLETSRTSIKKFYALMRAMDDDDVIRYTLQMNGAARTGREAGRIFQPQNLPRPEKRFEDYQPTLARNIEELDAGSLRLLHGNVFDVLASGLRPAAQAPPGMLFIDADLSAIENRVLGWLSGCEKILDVFRQNRDPYISFATYLYNEPYEKLWHEYKVEKNGAKRTIAKPGTLGCGYGMGAGAAYEDKRTGEIEASGLLGYAWNMGVTQFTQEDSQHSVDTFRREFKEVKEYWYALERAAKLCVRRGRPTELGVIRFEMDGPFLKMILPSKRPLYYLRPKIEPIMTPWGEEKMQLTYENLDERKQWSRTHTTPGKIVENADQAISRDLLVHGMKLAAKRGIDIRLHVHDQILGLVAEERAQDQLDVLIECMEEQPKWADGLPLGSNGFTTRIFMKD
jgi:DNA polymerase